MEIAIVALVPTKRGKEGKLFVWHHNGKLMKGWPQTVIPEDEYAASEVAGMPPRPWAISMGTGIWRFFLIP